MAEATEELSARETMAGEIDLPTGIAVWVLAAHFFVLFSALPVSWAVEVHREYLETVMFNPSLMHFGVGVYVAAIAFECAQNTMDKWYLTKVSLGICDCLFFVFMVWAFCLFTMACTGNPYVWAAAITIAIVHPLSYIAGLTLQFPLLGWSMFICNGAFYFTVGEPTVIFHSIMTGVGLAFLALLFKTRSQWLHGLGAASFGVSMLAWPWAITNAASGNITSWVSFGMMTGGLLIVAGVLVPIGLRSKATTRHADRESSAGPVASAA